MRKVRFASVFVLLVLLLSAEPGMTLAQNTHTQANTGLVQQAIQCAELVNPDEKIDIIVQFAHTPLQDSKEVRACYDSLTENQKVQILYRVAEKLGLSEELYAELHRAPESMGPLVWGTLLMPYTVVGYGQMRTAELYWIDDGSRCPTGRGIEYNFQYRFSSNVTDPASLRSNSPTNILVDAAILGYTLSYGGQKIWYDTTSPVITACVGDSALRIVGGPNVWKAHAVVYKP